MYFRGIKCIMSKHNHHQGIYNPTYKTILSLDIFLFKPWNYFVTLTYLFYSYSNILFYYATILNYSFSFKLLKFLKI